MRKSFVLMFILALSLIFSGAIMAQETAAPAPNSAEIDKFENFFNPPLGTDLKPYGATKEMLLLEEGEDYYVLIKSKETLLHVSGVTVAQINLDNGKTIPDVTYYVSGLFFPEKYFGIFFQGVVRLEGGMDSFEVLKGYFTQALGEGKPSGDNCLIWRGKNVEIMLAIEPDPANTPVVLIITSLKVEREISEEIDNVIKQLEQDNEKLKKEIQQLEQ